MTTGTSVDTAHTTLTGSSASTRGAETRTATTAEHASALGGGTRDEVDSMMMMDFETPSTWDAMETGEPHSPPSTPSDASGYASCQFASFSPCEVPPSLELEQRASSPTRADETQEAPDPTGAAPRSPLSSPQFPPSSSQITDFELLAKAGGEGEEGFQSEDSTKWGRLCSECGEVIHDAAFMLHDMAYCCERHRLVSSRRDSVTRKSPGIARTCSDNTEQLRGNTLRGVKYSGGNIACLAGTLPGGLAASSTGLYAKYQCWL